MRDSDARSRFRPSFPLVEAKFHPPTARVGLVRRRGLLERLAERPRAPIVSIVAPPGYGKTTLLSQCAAQHSGRPVAWLTLDEHDNDPSVLLTNLAVTLGRVVPLDDPLKGLLASRGTRLLSTVVPRILAALHEAREPVLIVLDDVHVLIDDTCLDAITEILDRLPPNVRVAMGARRPPRLRLARLRVAGVLLEIGPDDLSLDDDEVAELLSLSGKPDRALDAQALRERTEGWAAGVYLSILAAASTEPTIGTTAHGSDRNPYLDDYLRAEVWEQLDQVDMDLLRRTSILDHVEAPLASAVSGVEMTGPRLLDLASANMLISPIEGQLGSFRYHQLMRESLRHELDLREPELRPTLHLRAARWYAERGYLAQAIQHAYASEDLDEAARLVTRAALPTFYGGRPGLLDNWLARLPGDVLARQPSLVVIAGWIHLLNGRADDCLRMLDLAERLHVEGPPLDGAASFESARAMLRAAIAPRGVAVALKDARMAAASEPPSSPWFSNAQWLLGSTCWLAGDIDGAEEAWQTAIAGSDPINATAMVARTYRAIVAIGRHDWASAARLVAEARQTLVAAAFDEIIAAVIVYAAAARVAAHQGDRARAREELTRAQMLRPLLTHAAPWFAVRCVVEMARAYMALADPASARRILREAQVILRVRPDVGVLADEVRDLDARLRDVAPAMTGTSSLTPAELRLLPLLPTHLSFREIAARLFVSRNTVKTQALTLYGKLQVSSRSEAVVRAVELGLIEPFPVLSAGGQGPG